MNITIWNRAGEPPQQYSPLPVEAEARMPAELFLQLLKQFESCFKQAKTIHEIESKGGMYEITRKHCKNILTLDYSNTVAKILRTSNATTSSKNRDQLQSGTNRVDRPSVLPQPEEQPSTISTKPPREPRKEEISPTTSVKPSARIIYSGDHFVCALAWIRLGFSKADASVLAGMTATTVRGRTQWDADYRAEVDQAVQAALQAERRGQKQTRPLEEAEHYRDKTDPENRHPIIPADEPVASNAKGSGTARAGKRSQKSGPILLRGRGAFPVIPDGVKVRLGRDVAESEDDGAGEPEVFMQQGPRKYDKDGYLITSEVLRPRQLAIRQGLSAKDVASSLTAELPALLETWQQTPITWTKAETITPKQVQQILKIIVDKFPELNLSMETPEKIASVNCLRGTLPDNTPVILLNAVVKNCPRLRHEGEIYLLLSKQNTVRAAFSTVPTVPGQSQCLFHLQDSNLNIPPFIDWHDKSDQKPLREAWAPLQSWIDTQISQGQTNGAVSTFLLSRDGEGKLKLGIVGTPSSSVPAPAQPTKTVEAEV